MEIKIFVVVTNKPIIFNFLNWLKFRYNLKSLKLSLIKVFGGLTEDTQIRKGYWLNENKKLEFDKVLIWEILTDSENKGEINAKIETLRNISLNLKELTKQKSQLIEIDHKPIFL